MQKRSNLFGLQPTPANEHVEGETHGGVVDDEQQRVQVQTLHHTVVKEHQDDLTAHLTHTHTHLMYRISFLLMLIWSDSW